MAGRGRTAGFRMTDEHRTKIGNSQILKCLIEHAVGKREMSPSQVTAGLGLLRKVMPDLAATTLSGDLDNPLVITKIERVIVAPKDDKYDE
jgi:hypothetical protein